MYILNGPEGKSKGGFADFVACVKFSTKKLIKLFRDTPVKNVTMLSEIYYENVRADSSCTQKDVRLLFNVI